MSFVKYEYRSAALSRCVTVDIFLPTESYTPGKKPFKTLYFLPGYSADSTGIITWLRLKRQCELKGIAIVIPCGDNSFYIDHPERGTNYATFAAKELVEETRGMLPLSHRREDTFIGGISMGGCGSIFNGIRFSETFSKIAALSPAIDPYDTLRNAPGSGFSKPMLDNFFGSEEEFRRSDVCADHLYFDKDADVTKYPELFIACGTEDVLVYKQVDRFAKAMQEKNLPFTYRVESGKHDLDFWERMLDPMFSFLLDVPEGSMNELNI